MSKILFLGPKTNVQDPRLTGGAVVLFENLLEQCVKQKIDFHVIDTNKLNYSNYIFAYISIIMQLFWHQKDCNHISLHSSRDYIILGACVILLGKLLNKQTSLRKFGGEAANVYQNQSALRQKLMSFIFSNMDMIFFEMKHLVSFFSKINPNIHWFPNVRHRPKFPYYERSFNKRFVFISHVKHDKGVDEILEASNYFDDSYTFDIYGPISEPKYTDEYFSKFRANYRGALPPSNVLTTLNTYDVLMLPTFYKGEGYPGIIIEAYSMGIPIIATTLPGIMEITDQNETGLLIEPKNVEQLVSVIHYYNEKNYPVMSVAAYVKFNDFDADIQTKYFFVKIGALCSSNMNIV
jgi:glycosyltransferase involved in cell wall biosynthesis